MLRRGVHLSSLVQFVADGVFYAELNELLTRELAEDGYSGVEVRVTPLRTEIIIRATRTTNVLGKQTTLKLRALAGMVMAALRRSSKIIKISSIITAWQKLDWREVQCCTLLPA